MSYALQASKVFPAFGGETMSPLWPFPVGEIKSIILADKSSVVPLPDSITNLSSGNKGVKFSKAILILFYPFLRN